MNKKRFLSILAIFGAICLAIALVTVIVGTHFKGIGVTKVSLGSAKGVSGDVVEIPLKIKNNSGIWGGQIIIDYDSDNLSFVSASNGKVFDVCNVNDAGDCVAILATQSGFENSKNNGVIATLKFKVKISADKGTQSLKFNSDTNFCNADEEMIELVLKDGTITVK